jgi:hypothetical protein
MFLWKGATTRYCAKIILAVKMTDFGEIRQHSPQTDFGEIRQQAPQTDFGEIRHEVIASVFVEILFPGIPC